MSKMCKKSVFNVKYEVFDFLSFCFIFWIWRRKKIKIFIFKIPSSEGTYNIPAAQVPSGGRSRPRGLVLLSEARGG